MSHLVIDDAYLKAYCGHVLDVLRSLPDESVHCIVTSPPYWGLRDYGVKPQVWGGAESCAHQWIDESVEREMRRGVNLAQSAASTRGGGKKIAEVGWQRFTHGSCSSCGAWRGAFGLEPTPEMFIDHAVEIFREARRVLRNDGTLWLNIGDSYANDTKWGGSTGGKHVKALHASPIGRMKKYTGFKPKDLMMIPARLAIALCDDGWTLRAEIVWHKPSVMPESVTDRVTRAHEMVYMLAKSSRYFYDAEAIREPKAESTSEDGRSNLNGLRRDRAYPGAPSNGGTNLGGANGGRNKRSVWTVASEPYPESHFAVFPTALVEPMILAGTSAHGCCSACGAPYERILEPSAEYAQHLGKDWSNPEADDAEGRGHFELADGGKAAQRPVKRNAPSITADYITKGWKATCGCNADVQPCTVLDPFGGSGTTAVVAIRHGRRAILIDLNPDYIELQRKRCAVTPALALSI